MNQKQKKARKNRQTDESDFTKIDRFRAIFFTCNTGKERKKEGKRKGKGKGKEKEREREEKGMYSGLMPKHMSALNLLELRLKLAAILFTKHCLLIREVRTLLECVAENARERIKQP